jgi:hypothetical protein
MTIFNRRNALIGWLVVKAGKRKAKQSAPSKSTAVKAGAAAGGAAAVATGAAVLRKKKKSDESASDE